MAPATLELYGKLAAADEHCEEHVWGGCPYPRLP